MDRMDQDGWCVRPQARAAIATMITTALSAKA
jgi:hypothetical protein